MAIALYNETDDVQSKKQDMFAKIASLQELSKKKDRMQSDSERIEAFKKKVQTTVIKLVKTGEAPWLKQHDGNIEFSFFPESNYVPVGFTAAWLKIREQELHSQDPRWYSRKDIFGNGYRIKHNEKATAMCFQGTENVKYNYYWNASQLTGILPYEKKFAITEEKVATYYPQASGFGKDRTYYPHETLRADLTNWFNSLNAHAPYEPRGLNRTLQVTEYLEKSKSGTFFFVAKEASDTSKKLFLRESFQLNLDLKQSGDIERH